LSVSARRAVVSARVGAFARAAESRRELESRPVESRRVESFRVESFCVESFLVESPRAVLSREAVPPVRRLSPARAVSVAC
jgi:hypothetical protein